jgi:hypothetical protein
MAALVSDEAEGSACSTSTSPPRNRIVRYKRLLFGLANISLALVNLAMLVRAATETEKEDAWITDYYMRKNTSDVC